MRALPSTEPMDPGYRRLVYLRYADDHLLGFAGPKAEAEQVKASLAAFLCWACQLGVIGSGVMALQEYRSQDSERYSLRVTGVARSAGDFLRRTP
jgi:hypothetical protein